MGVAGIIRMLRDYAKMQELPAAVLASVLCLFVPIQMAGQTWDDHDRSGRFVARDFGQNYLMTLQEEGNPIIYTNGDNDTFPLWYNQETEGFRTDARTCNLSYLQTDWYIDQMKRPAYDSPSSSYHLGPCGIRGRTKRIYLYPSGNESSYRQLFQTGKRTGCTGRHYHIVARSLHLR